MKATDLMIGDWILVLQQGGHYKRTKVRGIFDDTIDYLLGEESHTITEGGVEPIPLNAEILEKNGWIMWKKTKLVGVTMFTQYFEDSLGIEDSIETRIDCDTNGDFHYMCNGESFCYINYVHQLQHALKLCGIEKEVVI